MATRETKATKSVTFRFEDEDFQVQLEVLLKDEKVVSVLDSTQLFFNYLKELNFVPNNVEINTWLNSSNNITLQLFSNSKNSFRIRKKAQILGLKIILGTAFQQRKEDSLKRALQTSRCLKSIN